MSLAPIVLFVYNRPEHTLKTLEALHNNILSAESELFIFADGCKDTSSPELKFSVAKVREIIHEKKWCGIVHCHESETNKGLYQSIRSGVTEIVERFGKVIVMEDDILTSPSFLTFMNKALDYYQDKGAVFSISGFNYPASIMKIPDDYVYDTYVSLRNASWGWATWKDRWNKIDWNVEAYTAISNTPTLKSALNRMGDDEFEMLEMRMTGRLNIWSIQFTVAHFVNHAVAIYPVVSYVNNIGNDGSGQNCGVTDRLHNKVLSTNQSPRFLDIIYEDSRIINVFYNISCRRKRPLWQKIVNRIYRTIGKEPPYVIKGKVYS